MDKDHLIEPGQGKELTQFGFKIRHDQLAPSEGNTLGWANEGADTDASNEVDPFHVDDQAHFTLLQCLHGTGVEAVGARLVEAPFYRQDYDFAVVLADDLHQAALVAATAASRVS